MTTSSETVRPLKHALVTGGARRVGAALVRALAHSGYRVACHVRETSADAEALVAEIRAAGGEASIFEADLAESEARATLIKRAVETFGPLHLLVNNAAAFSSDRFDDYSDAQFDQHLMINLKAPIDLARHFMKHAAADDPSIINVVDHRVLKLTPQHFTYTLSKAALHAATITMAQSLAPHIRVNAIGPGPVFPNIHDGPSGFSHETSGVPLMRAVDHADLAKAVLYLASARSVTGTLLPVDSGQAIGWKTPDIIF